MLARVSDLILEAAHRRPDDPAVVYGAETLTYGTLATAVERAAAGLLALGLSRYGRVAVYLEKRAETIVALFGAAAAGGAFVPINPQLKARQVCHILRDCGVNILVTSQTRLSGLGDSLGACPDLQLCVVTDAPEGAETPEASGGPLRIARWADLLAAGEAPSTALHPAVISDMAAILYTSGSTGLPKGVVLSHQNLILGAQSVASYLQNSADDTILSLLPLSFDAGLSQATTSFVAGAKLVLMNYLLPSEVVRVCASQKVTGLTGVPPLWIKLADLDWPSEAAEQMRYIANTGGHLPRSVLQKLRSRMSNAKPYLMYGLTEAFRSTYLDPELVDERPDSIGKAVPHAEVLVVRGDGSLCDAGEPGELVHRGPLVAMGYWNDPERTARRFRPLHPRAEGLTLEERAVWSGDTVRRDEDGYLYFIGRSDEMIKTSGYRISPTEIEDVAYRTGLVGGAVALGLPDEVLGQAIVLVVAPDGENPIDLEALSSRFNQELPRFMVPSRILQRESLPRNANGKFDRAALKAELTARVAEEVA